MVISTQAESKTLVRALQNPLLFGHPVKRFRLIETHISWVILTGKFAYKIKKPVNLGFVDFSTLEKRHFYCLEELRLNRRFAPDLYLDVVAIKGSPTDPVLGETGEIIEYAVKMREFSQHDLLSFYACEHRLEVAHIESLATLVADSHHLAPPADVDSLFGSVESIKKWTRENFKNIETNVDKNLLPEYFGYLKKWCLSSRNLPRNSMRERQERGFIRECHGDLHLGNIALIKGRVTAFDCIEFDPGLRWVDTVSEIAFIAMDLCAHDYVDYAWQFISRYLQISGDYAGIQVLRYYLVYRAMVRAKIEALRIAQENPAIGRHSESYCNVTRYTELARSWTTNHRATIIIMHGLSGSGKSTMARHLVGTIGAIQIRSDVERKRLFSLKPEENSASALEQNIYTQEATNRTYDQLQYLASVITRAGFGVIVDASFLKPRHRDQFRRLASKYQTPFIIISCNASEAILRERIRQRIKRHNDPSEANLDVLQHQLKTLKTITPGERDRTNIISCNESTLTPEQKRILKGIIKAP